MEKTNKEELRSKIASLVKVSTLPEVLNKVMAVVDDEEGTAFALKKVIEHDQSIATKVLSMANSAFYGLSGTVSTLSQAILVLGFTTVKNIAISVSIFDNLNGNKKNVSDLWVHSMKVAMASSLIASKTGCVNKDSAFLAGLVHDIGKAVLLQLFDKEYIKVATPDDEGLLDRELENFGAHHSETGTWLAEQYNLPEDCIDSIKFHHRLGECTPREPDSGLINLPPVVYMANWLVKATEQSEETNITPDETTSNVMRTIDLDADLFAEISEKIREMDEEVHAYFQA